MSSSKAPCVRVSWDVVDVLTEELHLDKWAVKNTVNLLDNDNTIPFIARYRREQTNNMEADTLRNLQEKYQQLKSVEQKIQTVYKAVEKEGKMNKTLQESLASAQTFSEVEHLYAPYKSGSKRTLAERARELGLETYSTILLHHPHNLNLNLAVNPQQKGLATLAEVESGVQHIVADIISKDKDTMDKVRELCKTAHVTLESSKSNAVDKKSKASEKKVEKKSVKPGAADKKAALPNANDVEKFRLYFNFSIPVKYAKPHQVMAINRGESLKFLTVHIRIPDSVHERFDQYCRGRWVPHHAPSHAAERIMTAAQDAYKRLIQPLMVRNFRCELTKQAERASVEVFAGNLKQLLLGAPVRGKVVLGVDPGFRHGCKWAMLSATGAVLDHGISYLTDHNPHTVHKETARLAQAMIKHRCETVVIGNGTACRETEQYFSQQIHKKAFSPLNVQYCIVNEAGASIYSASDEAKKEMPDLDISIRGAVSIGRRVQDPLAELVKIEPKHVGVGMYQHDVPESQLQTALNGVVEECVSFVGVDINSASLVLLRHVAGMTVARAKKLLEYRESVGSFLNRQQLLSVKGIGPKVFEQCAGFIRVVPLSDKGHAVQDSNSENMPASTEGTSRKRKATSAASGARSKKARVDEKQQANPLDMTSIHPESYSTADQLMKDVCVNKQDIGQHSFIKAMRNYMEKRSVADVAVCYDVGVPTMQLILDGLQQPLGHDIRQEFEKPLFKQGVRSLTDLKCGVCVSGKVTNVTHFGAFVDIGVGVDGLLHNSQMAGHKLLLGNRLEVTVTQVEPARKRIGLRFSRLL